MDWDAEATQRTIWGDARQLWTIAEPMGEC